MKLCLLKVTEDTNRVEKTCPDKPQVLVMLGAEEQLEFTSGQHVLSALHKNTIDASVVEHI